jgi:hypothetical protein
MIELDQRKMRRGGLTLVDLGSKEKHRQKMAHPSAGSYHDLGHSGRAEGFHIQMLTQPPDNGDAVMDCATLLGQTGMPLLSVVVFDIC